MENNPPKRSRSRSTSKKESLENKKVIEKEKKAQEDLDKAKDALLLEMNMKDHYEEIMGLTDESIDNVDLIEIEDDIEIEKDEMD